MKVKSLIAEVRYQLSDIEGLGYSDDLLIEFINDGLCFIYDLKPELFAESRVLKAQCGDVQIIDECCDRLLSVDAISSPTGIFVDIIRQTSVKMARDFDKTPAGIGARTWSMRENVYNEFYVWPPVEKCECVYFRVTCTVPPDPVVELTDQVPDCKHHEALVQYILWRAYLMETESTTSLQLSQVCYDKIFQILGIERQTDNSMRETNGRYNKP